MSGALSPVFAFLRRPSMVDFPGRMAAVFFTSGCNFHCGFCHNASLMGSEKPGLPWAKIDEALLRFKADWVNAAAVTGGEPSLAPGIRELIALFRKHHLAVKIDSNGSRPEALRDLAPAVDCLAMDVKASLEAYPELTGWTVTESIRESVEVVKGMGGKGLLRTTIIEPFHTDAMMHRIGELIAGCEVYQMHPFVPREELPGPAYRQLHRTSEERLEALRELMKPYAKRIVIRGG